MAKRKREKETVAPYMTKNHGSLRAREMITWSLIKRIKSSPEFREKSNSRLTIRTTKTRFAGLATLPMP